MRYDAEVEFERALMSIDHLVHSTLRKRATRGFDSELDGEAMEVPPLVMALLKQAVGQLLDGVPDDVVDAAVDQAKAVWNARAGIKVQTVEDARRLLARAGITRPKLEQMAQRHRHRKTELQKRKAAKRRELMLLRRKRRQRGQKQREEEAGSGIAWEQALLSVDAMVDGEGMDWPWLKKKATGAVEWLRPLARPLIKAAVGQVVDGVPDDVIDLVVDSVIESAPASRIARVVKAADAERLLRELGWTRAKIEETARRHRHRKTELQKQKAEKRRQRTLLSRKRRQSGQSRGGKKQREEEWLAELVL